MRNLIERFGLKGYGRDDLEVAVVLVVACVSLAVLDTYGKPYSYPPVDHPSQAMLAEVHARAGDLRAANPDELGWVTQIANSHRHRFVPAAFVWWAAFCALTYLLLPLATALVLCRGDLARFDWLGLSPRGFFRHAGTYCVLVLLMVPVLLITANSKEFRIVYPFQITAHLDLRTWIGFELCYLVQFFSLEFFFRGYLLFTLERHMGRRAIFVSAVPCCMIHFGKPFPEILGAIGGAIVLGELALRYRSIWGGVAIHFAVALMMDTLALAHAGSLARMFGHQ